MRRPVLTYFDVCRAPSNAWVGRGPSPYSLARSQTFSLVLLLPPLNTSLLLSDPPSSLSPTGWPAVYNLSTAIWYNSWYHLAILAVSFFYPLDRRFKWDLLFSKLFVKNLLQLWFCHVLLFWILIFPSFFLIRVDLFECVLTTYTF